jgi:hypothetical protein
MSGVTRRDAIKLPSGAATVGTSADSSWVVLA